MLKTILVDSSEALININFQTQQLVNGLAVWQNGDKSILFGGLYWLIKDDTSSEFAHYSAVPDLNSYCPYKFNNSRYRD